MGGTWNDYGFVVQMPHMAPGEKLSEVEFLKQLAAYQWESISRMLGCKPSEIVNEQNERLYGSVIDVELHFAPSHGLEVFGEDAHVRVRNHIRMFAKRFVEGLFVIADEDIPESLLSSVKSRQDLASLSLSWGCMTNAFIARAGGNLKLKVFRPAGLEEREIAEMPQTPEGIRGQGQVHGSGEIPPLAPEDADAIPLVPRRDERILYTIVPESDLNGAGLVYFARYESMMNYGERLFLGGQLGLPVSNELISYLSPEHRKAFFFANASPTDAVEVRVAASVLPGAAPHRPAPPGHRVPLRMVFRIDLYRASDNVLMASSLVRKALHVPGNAKGVLMECERLLRAWT